MIDTEAINGILTKVTSGSELNPDDLEQMQSDFRQEFSATKKKGEIVQLIVNFLKNFENEEDMDTPDFMSDDNEDEDPSRNLKNELNRAFNAFKDSFSIFRAAGQEDPEDEHKNQSISDDGSMVWNSNDEDATADFKINAREKKIITKNFLKMVKIGQSKQRLFQQTMNEWRYKALQLKLKKSYLIHQTFFNFRRKMDHRLARAFGVLRFQNRLINLESETRNDIMDLPREQPTKTFYRKRKQESKTEVITLRPSAPEEPEYEEVKHSVPTMTGRYRSSDERFMGKASRNMDEAMDNFIMDQNLTIDPEISKKFTNLNRARYVRQVLAKLQTRNRDWAFYTILKVNSKRSRAIQNVNDRVKGKLMMALHKNFSKDQVKSSYYKWYIKSNPHILKKLATNMLIKLQMSNTVASWRMISLVRTHKTRDERAIMLRLAKGLMELMSTVKVHQLQDSRNAMQKMNPNHYTRKSKLLEKTLVRLLRSKANKAKQAFERLRRGPVVCQKVFNRLGNNLKTLKSGALARLRFNRLSKNDQKRANGLEKLREYMERKLGQNRKTLVDNMKKKQAKGNMILNRLMDKLGLSKRLALKKLQINAMRSQGNEEVGLMNNNLNEMRRKLMLEQLARNIQNKKRRLISNLRKNAEGKAKIEEEQKLKQSRLGQMMLRCQTGRMYLALSKLRDLKAEQEKAEGKKGAMFRDIGERLNSKLFKSYIKLINFNREKKDQENTQLSNRDMLAKKLLRGLMAKQSRALGRMVFSKNNAVIGENNKNMMCDNLFKGLKNYTRLTLSKALKKMRANMRFQNGNDLKKNRIAMRLGNANLRKLGEALQKLRAQGMVMESHDERKNRYLNFMLRNQKGRLRAAFYKLTMLKNLKNAEANEELKTSRGMLLGLMGNQREKLRHALDILRRTAEKGGSQEAMEVKDKQGLLRLLGNRANLLKERVLLKMGKGARQKEKQETIEKLRKDGLMGILLSKSDDRLKRAFYKLIFNRKRQERNEKNRGNLMKDFAQRMRRVRHDTINKLRGKAQAERQEEERKARNINMLANMLKEQSTRKLGAALMKLLRNKAEKADNEQQQKELTRNIFKMLGLKGSDILGQAYRKLIMFKNKGKNEEKEKEVQTRNIGGLLLKNTRTKLHMALLKLLRNFKNQKMEDGQKSNLMSFFARKINKNKNNLLWKLLTQQKGKEMEQVQRTNVKSKLLLKMGDNSRARLADALHKLMINSLENRFDSNNKEKQQVILLNLMKGQGKLDKQRALLNLMHNRKEKEKEEEKLNSDVIGILEKLKSKTMRMKFSALARLRAFRKIQMKKNNKKKFLMELFGNRIERNKDRTIMKMLKNAKEGAEKEQHEKVSKNKMIGGLLLKSSNKLHTAFYRLMLFGIKEEKNSQVVEKIKEKILGKFNLKGRSLIRDAFYRLWVFKNKKRIEAGDQNMMVNLLRRTQTVRLREALLKLKMQGNKLFMAMQDPVKRRSLMRLLLELIDRNNNLRRSALKKLRNFNQDKKKEEVLKGSRPTMTAEQLRRELENRINNPKADGRERNFHEIENYLKRFPKEGQNKELLDAIRDGKIKNMEDLYNYLDDKNDPEGFKNIYDLLENKNLPVELLKKLLPVKIGLNDSNDVLKNLKNNPDTKLGDLMNSLQKNNKDGKNARAFQAARGLKKVSDAIDEMLRNNEDGRYSKVLCPLRKDENPDLTKLMNLLNDPTLVKQEHADAIRDFLNLQNDPNALVNMLDKIVNNSDNGIDNALAQSILNKDHPSAIDFVRDNKRTLDNPANEKIRKALNGHDKPTLKDFLERAAAFNAKNGWMDDQIDNLEKNGNDRLTVAYEDLKSKEGDSPQSDFLRNLINGRPTFEDMMDYMDTQEDLKPLKERLMLLGKGSGPTPIKSNDDLLDRLYLLRMEEDSEEFDESLDTVWGILDNLISPEKTIDMLKGSANARKYLPVIRKNKNTEGGLGLEDLYNTLKKNRLVNDEVKNLLNEGKDDPSRTPAVKLVKDYVSDIENKTSAEEKFLRSLDGSENMGQLLDKLADANKKGEIQNIVDFVDYSMNPNELDKIRKFADKNRDVNPQMAALSDLIAKNPDMNLLDVLTAIAEEPETYGESTIDGFLNGDIDRPAGVVGILKWAEENNEDQNLDKLIDGIKEKLDEDGRDELTDLADRARRDNKGGLLKPALDKLNQKDMKNAMQDIMKYIRDNNDDGKYDQILDDLAKVDHPDLNDLNNILLQHKGDPAVAKLIDLLNGKKLSNNDILEWLKANNADGRYDDIIKALEENPDMTRAELMKMIRDKNENGELDDLLNYITTEGHVQPKSAWENFLDYLAKHRDNENFQEAYDYLDTHGLKDPYAFRDYLMSINDDGKYDEMIRLLNAFLDEEQKNSKYTSAYDFKLFKPLKKMMIYYLNKLRRFNKDTAVLDEKRNTKLYQTFLNLNTSNRDKLRAALRILRDNKTTGKEKELNEIKTVAKVLDKSAFAMKKHDYRDMARAINKLIRFRNRKHLFDLFARKIQQSNAMRCLSALRKLKGSAIPSKKKMELMTILMMRTQKFKQFQALQKLINLRKDERRLNMQSRLSNLYWNLRRNHLKEKRHAFNIWAMKDFKNKMRTVSDKLKKFVLKKKMKVYNHQKQLYFEMKYKKLLDGNDTLKKFLREKDQEHKVKVVESIFDRKNPWIGRILEVLTRRVQVNEQILLWRLVDELKIEKTSKARTDVLRSTILKQM